RSSPCTGGLTSAGPASLVARRSTGRRLVQAPLDAIGYQAGDGQGGGGGRRRCVAHVQGPLRLRDREVVEEGSVAVEGLGPHTREVGLEVPVRDLGQVVGRGPGQGAAARGLAHLGG